ncbi:MAG: hypothetical protein VXW91_04400 [Pseudomonadota bacterium]|nr:hypothetical protein [Pseudomonadota bacterium]
MSTSTAETGLIGIYEINRIFKGHFEAETIQVHFSFSEASKIENLKLVETFKWGDNQYYSYPQKTQRFELLWPQGKERTLKTYFENLE